MSPAGGISDYHPPFASGMTGSFTISLDFELYWGVRDKRSLEGYRRNLEGVWEAVPAMLKAFETHGIHATWATVGILFLKDREELLLNLPKVQPGYQDDNLSAYRYFHETETLSAQHHFAPELIARIEQTPGQELASHTFCHYYCLESGQTVEAFVADAKAFQAATQRRARSIVFPRNQTNQEYLKAIGELGIECYRGNETAWCYRATSGEEGSQFHRLARLLDTYVNLSGHNTYALNPSEPLPYNFPSSRFLRPYCSKLKALEPLRLRRILNSMTHAARRGEVFHLWWHPHNFGANLAENMKILTRILEHYKHLKQQHGFESRSMSELLNICLAETDHHG